MFNGSGKFQAQTVSVFIDTNHFREDLPQYWNMAEERLGSQQYTKPGGKGKADVFKDNIKHEPKEQREQSQTRLSSAESRLRKSNAQFRSPC